jgi:hypothetical protein
MPAREYTEEKILRILIKIEIQLKQKFEHISFNYYFNF